MGIVGKGFLACVAAAAVVAAIGIHNQPSPAAQPAPPKTDADEALDQCRAAIARSYGLSSIRGIPAASDKWRDHGGTGGYDSLWIVFGKNAFGMPAENVIACEAGTKVAGAWTMPFLWNVTLNGDRLDPGTVAHPARSFHRHREQSALHSMSNSD